MDDVLDFVEQYKQIRPTYEILTSRIEEIVKSTLHEKKIKIDQIQARTKEIDSFKEKINRDGKNYKNPLKELTDLSGIRIIVFSIKDIEPIESALRKEFEIDNKNSCDKSKKLELNEFGYVSTHLIVSLPKTRLNLIENKNLKGKKGEIQIRTVLQHAWATIDHTVRYKNQFELPEDTKRNFFRLAAVLELADVEFQNIIDTHKKIIKIYDKQLKKNSYKSIALNSQSLMQYLLSPSVEKKLKSINIDRFNLDTGKKIYPSTQLIEILNRYGFDSLDKIDALITNIDKCKKNLEVLVSTWKKDIKDENLKLVFTKLNLLRIIVYYNIPQDKQKQLLKEGLVTGNIKKYILTGEDRR